MYTFSIKIILFFIQIIGAFIQIHDVNFIDITHTFKQMLLDNYVLGKDK